MDLDNTDLEKKEGLVMPTFEPRILEWLKANRPGYLEDLEKCLATAKQSLRAFKEAEPAYMKIQDEIRPQVNAIFAKRDAPQDTFDYLRYEHVSRLANRMADNERDFENFALGKYNYNYDGKKIEAMKLKIDPEIVEAQRKRDSVRINRDEENEMVRELQRAHRMKHLAIYKAYESAQNLWNGNSSAWSQQKQRVEESADLAEAFMDPKAYLERMVKKQKEDEEMEGEDDDE
jgi:hypothetical protein